MRLRLLLSFFIASLYCLCLPFSVAQGQTTTVTTPTTLSSKAAKPALSTRPHWAELTTEQQAALAPLQPEWSKLSDGQKRKWVEISKNYNKLKLDDQTKLHNRMHDWVTLTPLQRTQARLNFSTARAMTPEEKQKHWEAYQALSPEEKQKLQAKAKASTPNSAVLANKPQNKLISTIQKPE